MKTPFIIFFSLLVCYSAFAGTPSEDLRSYYKSAVLAAKGGDLKLTVGNNSETIIFGVLPVFLQNDRSPIYSKGINATIYEVWSEKFGNDPHTFKKVALPNLKRLVRIAFPKWDFYDYGVKGDTTVNQLDSDAQRFQQAMDPPRN